MTPDELAEIVLAGVKFQAELNVIAVNSIRQDLPSIATDGEPAAVDWNHSLFC